MAAQDLAVQAEHTEPAVPGRRVPAGVTLAALQAHRLLARLARPHALHQDHRRQAPQPRQGRGMRALRPLWAVAVAVHMYVELIALN